MNTPATPKPAPDAYIVHVVAVEPGTPVNANRAPALGAGPHDCTTNAGPNGTCEVCGVQVTTHALLCKAPSPSMAEQTAADVLDWLDVYPIRVERVPNLLVVGPLDLKPDGTIADEDADWDALTDDAREAVRLLRQIAELEKDPGSKGYSEGMAQRIVERREDVRPEYLEQLRRGIAELQAGGVRAPG